MNWFRFYHEALDDPKVQRLSPPLFKHWVNVLCLASMNVHRGMVPNVDDVAFRLRLSVPQAVKVMADLVRAGLVEEDDGDFVIHNWTGRQRASDDAAERQRKRRGSGVDQEDDPLPVTDVSRDTSRDSHALDTEKSRERLRAEGEREGEGETSPARAQKALPISQNLEMTDDDVNAALSAGVPKADIEQEWRHFTGYYEARQHERRSNWQAQWRSWLGKRDQFERRQPQNGASTGRASAAAATADAFQRIARGD